MTMKKVFYLLSTLLFMMITGCRSSSEAEKTSLNSQIQSLEKKLFGQDANYNDQDARKLMQLYLRYADSLPADSVSPDYLFKAADISLYQQTGQQTVGILDQLITEYPGHRHHPMSVFLKAFVYDTKMGDTAAARRFYTSFLQEFPEHEFADDATFALRNLGKSPEDLIREFEQMNQ